MKMSKYRARTILLDYLIEHKGYNFIFIQDDDVCNISVYRRGRNNNDQFTMTKIATVTITDSAFANLYIMVYRIFGTNESLPNVRFRIVEDRLVFDSQLS